MDLSALALLLWECWDLRGRNTKTRSADSRSVRLEDGPGASGTAIQGGVSQRRKARDVVIIPAGVHIGLTA